MVFHLLKATSHSWTRHSSFSSLWLLGWLIYLSFGYHNIFRASISVLGECCQLHLVSPLHSREVIQLISVPILLSLHSMFSIPDPVLYLHYYVWVMIIVKCRWWGIHQGPPATVCFLLTLAHYWGSWLQTPLVPWCLHTSMSSFLTLSDMFTSMAFDWNTMCGVRHQLINSHHMDCIVVS